MTAITPTLGILCHSKSVLGSINDTCIMIRIMIQKMYQASSIKIQYFRCISISITDTLTMYQYHESLIYSYWYFYYCSLSKCKDLSHNCKSEKPNNLLISQCFTYLINVNKIWYRDWTDHAVSVPWSSECVPEIKHYAAVFGTCRTTVQHSWADRSAT